MIPYNSFFSLKSLDKWNTRLLRRRFWKSVVLNRCKTLRIESVFIKAKEACLLRKTFLVCAFVPQSTTLLDQQSTSFEKRCREEHATSDFAVPMSPFQRAALQYLALFRSTGTLATFHTEISTVHNEVSKHL